MEVTVIDGTPILMFSEQAIVVRKNTQKKSITCDTKFRSIDDLLLMVSPSLSLAYSTADQVAVAAGEQGRSALSLFWVSSFGFPVETRDAELET
jgi:hypothetical protein